ncbi:MAG: hypothetical protein K2X66_15270 [Cyanobacteria bacterium]|nr:hypothetical protein [Cyanobacteriota bacterium]
MALKYGELEKYLGKKYASDLTTVGGVYFEEATEILDGSLKVLEFYNRLNLSLKGKPASAVAR